MKKIKDPVSLTKVASHHIESLREFTLHKQQLAFTSLPVPAYEKCLLDHKRFPVAILEGDLPVGFFVLDQGTDVLAYSQSSHAVLLRAFSINLPHQGRGIAKASLQQLKPFMNTHLPHCREVVLGVNQNNPTAKKVYLGAGFRDTGKEKIGRSGPMAILKVLI
ncbi:GNAT family N-acetyltransferase [Pseudalkalibacillus hwajinpoensis]|uniref:GNAT family N-acetyltransferase n=1 Tax=Guptibacillus hwajinpoensis TaxID=208199 RepID=UPI001CFCA1E7|nr:GNAT family N-acetyltransferase [Pseudalkalibacillus hwajinpoensis]